jgi:hypothetical protein
MATALSEMVEKTARVMGKVIKKYAGPPSFKTPAVNMPLSLPPLHLFPTHTLSLSAIRISVRFSVFVWTATTAFSQAGCM